MRNFLVFCLVLCPVTVSALELYGVVVDNIERVAFREAIKNSGAEVVREAGDDNWFDIYNVSAQFPESRKFFVGYEKNAGRFAFAEYQLDYDYFDKMLLRLEAKYGISEKTFGQFASDIKHRWQVDGIAIELQRDWYSNHVRLIYSRPDTLAQLRQAYQQSQLNQFNQSLKVDEKYF